MEICTEVPSFPRFKKHELSREVRQILEQIDKILSHLEQEIDEVIEERELHQNYDVVPSKDDNIPDQAV